MKKLIIILSATALLSGCSAVSTGILDGKTNAEWQDALKGLETSGHEERLYIARDLKEAFVSEKDDSVRRVRAAYGLLRIAKVEAKEGHYGSALEECTFVYTKSSLRKAAEGGVDNFAKKTGKIFGATIASVLPAAVELRSDERWDFLRQAYDIYARKMGTKGNKTQVYVIKHAVSMNNLDEAYEEGSYEKLVNVAKIHAKEAGGVIARKIVSMAEKDRLAGKNIMYKYIIMNNDMITRYYEKTKKDIDKKLQKFGKAAVK